LIPFFFFFPHRAGFKGVFQVPPPRVMFFFCRKGRFDWLVAKRKCRAVRTLFECRGSFLRPYPFPTWALSQGRQFGKLNFPTGNLLFPPLAATPTPSPIPHRCSRFRFGFLYPDPFPLLSLGFLQVRTFQTPPPIARFSWFSCSASTTRAVFAHL